MGERIRLFQPPREFSDPPLIQGLFRSVEQLPRLLHVGALLFQGGEGLADLGKVYLKALRRHLFLQGCNGLVERGEDAGRQVIFAPSQGLTGFLDEGGAFLVSHAEGRQVTQIVLHRLQTRTQFLLKFLLCLQRLLHCVLEQSKGRLWRL